MTPLEYDILTAARPLLAGLATACAIAFAAGAAGDMTRRELQRRWTRRAARGLPTARPGFDRSASWWVDQHGARPVRHHRVTWSAEVRAGVRLRVAATRARWAVRKPRPLFDAEWVTA